MHIWTMTKWQKIYIKYDPDRRRGLRLRFDKMVNTEVRRACKEFCIWLRKEYVFPKRIVIYVKASTNIKARDGEMVSATILLPYDKDAEPYIKISTGDYEEMKEKYGKDDALARIIRSFAHELTHYFQWINNLKLTDVGEERQANAYSNFILDEYSDTRQHP